MLSIDICDSKTIHRGHHKQAQPQAKKKWLVCVEWCYKGVHEAFGTGNNTRIHPSLKASVE